jgi:hypothetical protein
MKMWFNTRNAKRVRLEYCCGILRETDLKPELSKAISTSTKRKKQIRGK